MKARRRGEGRRKKGLKGRMKGDRGQERERERSSGGDRLGTLTGAERRGPINRRALSQSRKTAKLHLPF